MSTFEQYRRDPCVALPMQRLVITAPQARPAVLGQPSQTSTAEPCKSYSADTHVNPRECDHNYIPIPGGDVGCTICGWWWSPEDEVLSK